MIDINLVLDTARRRLHLQSDKKFRQGDDLLACQEAMLELEIDLPFHTIEGSLTLAADESDHTLSSTTGIVQSITWPSTYRPAPTLGTPYDLELVRRDIEDGGLAGMTPQTYTITESPSGTRILRLLPVPSEAETITYQYYPLGTDVQYDESVALPTLLRLALIAGTVRNLAEMYKPDMLGYWNARFRDAKLAAHSRQHMPSHEPIRRPIHPF